jgi:hypothetical protein
LRCFCGGFAVSGAGKNASVQVGTQPQGVSAPRLAVSEHPLPVLNAARLVRGSFSCSRATALPSLLCAAVIASLTQERVCGATTSFGCCRLRLHTPMPVTLSSRNVGTFATLMSAGCIRDHARQHRRSTEWPRPALSNEPVDRCLRCARRATRQPNAHTRTHASTIISARVQIHTVFVQTRQWRGNIGVPSQRPRTAERPHARRLIHSRFGLARNSWHVPQL